MKHIRIIVFVIILIFGFSLFYQYSFLVKDEYCITTQISSKIFDFNTFRIILDDELKEEDFKVINLNSGNVIYNRGEYNKGIKNEYGHCLFELIYKNNREYLFGHFKKNNWYTNDYILRIKQENDSIRLQLEILGENASYDDFFIRKL